ncbi:MAG: hypothetical protein KQI62_11295 [Deltaproteobacteria bacterium]|nr:hypothetical protein [Deltaproteobacteria bacterium]
MISLTLINAGLNIVSPHIGRFSRRFSARNGNKITPGLSGERWFMADSRNHGWLRELAGMHKSGMIGRRDFFKLAALYGLSAANAVAP